MSLLALDGVGVNAAIRRYVQALHQLHLAGGGEIEETALLDHRLHDGRMRHGFQGVVQIDSRSALPKLAELHAHALAVEDQERRTELPDEAADFRGLERVDESRASHLRKFTAATALVPVPSSLSADAGRGAQQAIADGLPALPVRHCLHENALAAGLGPGYADSRTGRGRSFRACARH